MTSEPNTAVMSLIYGHFASVSSPLDILHQDVSPLLSK